MKEYKVLDWTNMKTDAREHWLNEFGQRGWRLTQVVHGFHYLERELNEAEFAAQKLSQQAATLERQARREETQR